MEELYLLLKNFVILEILPNPILCAAVSIAPLLFLLYWVRIPSYLVYYYRDDTEEKVVTLNSWSERSGGRGNKVGKSVRGKLSVFLFCIKHRINMGLLNVFPGLFIEFFLMLALLPDPEKHGHSYEGPDWAGWSTKSRFGETRLEYLMKCISRMVWPWKLPSTLRRFRFD